MGQHPLGEFTCQNTKDRPTTNSTWIILIWNTPQMAIWNILQTASSMMRGMHPSTHQRTGNFPTHEAMTTTTWIIPQMPIWNIPPMAIWNILQTASSMTHGMHLWTHQRTGDSPIHKVTTAMTWNIPRMSIWNIPRMSIWNILRTAPAKMHGTHTGTHQQIVRDFPTRKATQLSFLDTVGDTSHQPVDKCKVIKCNSDNCTATQLR